MWQDYQLIFCGSFHNYSLIFGIILHDWGLIFGVLSHNGDAVSSSFFLNTQLDDRLRLRCHSTVLHIPPKRSHVAGRHVVSAEEEWPNPGWCIFRLKMIARDSVVGRKTNTKCYGSHWLMRQVQLFGQRSGYMHVVHPEIWGLLCFPVERVHHVLPTDRFTFSQNLFRNGWRRFCRSQRPCGLGHEMSSFARTLRSLVRIQLKAWMSVCVYSVFVWCPVCR
jgi:hypothetical protein